MTTETNSARDQWRAFIEANNIAFEMSAPLGEVDKRHGAEPWPCIAYVVSITHDNKSEAFPYKLGVGHVSWQRAAQVSYRMPRELESIVNTMAERPMAAIKDSAALARTAAAVAAFQRVTPNREEVLATLISDGSAFFDAQSFEEWAGDYGYDTDSRTAEATFRACADVGRRLVRLLGSTLIAEARKLEGL